MREPTLKDVAEAAGVHAATASRALNPQTRGAVAEATARKVIAVAESLGYRGNPIARSLKTSRSGTVGLLIPDLTHPLYPPIIRGVEEALNAHGYSVWIASTDGRPEREQRLVDSMRSRQVEGLILATALREDGVLAELYRNDAVKMVLVNRRIEDVPVPSVVSDDASGIRQAVKHLRRLGHSRIAHIAGPQTTSTGADRARAFHDAMRDNDIDADPLHIAYCEDWRDHDGAAACRELLDRGAVFSAVVAANDMLAMGCYDALAERGMRCPADVSVVGFNDMPLLDRVNPPLTTVRVRKHDLGVEAGRMLLECIGDNEYRPRSVLVPVELVVRESTAPAPG